MTAKHTPGPWSADMCKDYIDGTSLEVLDAENFPIATIEASPIINRWQERFPNLSHWADADDGSTHRDRPQDQLEANARLIAAAPDLLAALREMTALFEMTDEAQQPGTDSYTILHQARAALSSATSSAAEG